MGEKSGNVKKVLLIIVALVVLGCLIWGAIVFFKSLAGQTAPPKQKIQTFKLVAPPPPPPPPPPPEVEEPPEPEDEPEPEPEPEPEAEPEPDEGPDDSGGEDLEMDAPLGEGGNYGIKQGKPKCTINCGKGSLDKFSGNLKQQVMRLLSDNEEVRKATYNVILKLWLTNDGRVDRAELLGTSGSADTDDALLLALENGKKLGIRPPKNMPQPVKMRIVSRN